MSIYLISMRDSDFHRDGYYVQNCKTNFFSLVEAKPTQMKTKCARHQLEFESVFFLFIWAVINIKPTKSNFQCIYSGLSLINFFCVVLTRLDTYFFAIEACIINVSIKIFIIFIHSFYFPL